MKILVLKFLNPIKRFTNYFPFTLYFILFGCGIVISYFFLINKLVAPESSFTAVLQLLISIIVFTTVTYLFIGLLSVFIPWIIVLISKKRKRFIVELNNDFQKNEISSNQIIQVNIHPILKPFLGFLKIRIQYDDDQFTDKLSLTNLKSSSFFSKNLEADVVWPLAQIKQYYLQHFIIYFEDYFQFFSLPIQQSIQSQFINNAKELKVNSITTQPKKTEETNIRITDLRKVEGEYLNYKNFENNDDVRRIVWKIYAKNKELVIRTPEVLDPFASHVYLYTSFHSIFQFHGNSVVEIPFLNYYKTLIWSAYKQLSKQNFEVKFVLDQKVTSASIFSEPDSINNHISLCNWQQQNSLNEYCKVSDASILIISSLNDSIEVENIIEQSSNSVTVIFIKLSESLKTNNILDWVEWLFIQKEKNDIEKYKAHWSFNTLKNKILANEQKIEKVIKNQLTSSKLEKA